MLFTIKLAICQFFYYNKIGDIMDKIVLIDKQGKEYLAEIIFTYYIKEYNKNYLVYLINKDLLAASFELKNEQYIIDNNLTDREFDILDEIIAKKIGENNA